MERAVPWNDEDDAFEGGGTGGELVRRALDVRAQGGSIGPTCSLVADGIRRHDGYRDLLHATGRG